MIKKLKLKRNEKMARTKNRIKKMTFQPQISEEHKYIIEMHRQGRYIQDRRQLQRELIGRQDEILPRITGGGL